MKLVQLGIGIVLLSLLISMVGGCQQSFSPGTFTDDMGREVTIDEVPQRIVSHVPSITELLFALGLEERVVGVSDFCNYPEAVKAKPKVGGFYNPSIEKIVDLSPDVVLTNGEVENLVTGLDSLGITYVVLYPEDIGGIFYDVELVGRVTGTESKARELTKDMEERIAHVVARVQDAPTVKVFYTFATTDLNNPWTARAPVPSLTLLLPWRVGKILRLPP
ncbi:helical backbone metal receptor [Chloroflexota bacterium]